MLKEIKGIEESDYNIPVDPELMFGDLLKRLDASIIKKKTAFPSYYSPDGPMFKCPDDTDKTPEEMVKDQAMLQELEDQYN